MSAAVAVHRAYGNRRAEQAYLASLASVHSYLGDYTSAIPEAETALSVARLVKNRIAEGRILGSLGRMYSEVARLGRGA